MVAPDIEGVVAGAPFYSASNEDEIDEALDRLTDSMKSNVKCTDEGVVIRADAIGSLEALAYELSATNIPIAPNTKTTTIDTIIFLYPYILNI